MNMPLLHIKSSLSTILQKTLTFTQDAIQQLCALCVYGTFFVCLVTLGIATHTLMNDQHLHLVATIDGKEHIVIDLRPNSK